MYTGASIELPKVEEGTREKFSNVFQWMSNRASLCLRYFGRRETLGNQKKKKKTNIGQQKGEGGEPGPSAHAGVPPPLLLCVSASAYGNECQCSSRKHDLGWNNPFGKGPRPFSFVPLFLCISLSLSRFFFFPGARCLIFFFCSSRTLSNVESPALPRVPAATRVSRVCEIEFNLKLKLPPVYK